MSHFKYCLHAAPGRHFILSRFTWQPLLWFYDARALKAVSPKMLGNRIGECKYLPTLCQILFPTESRKVPDSDITAHVFFLLFFFQRDKSLSQGRGLMTCFSLTQNQSLRFKWTSQNLEKQWKIWLVFRVQIPLEFHAPCRFAADQMDSYAAESKDKMTGVAKAELACTHPYLFHYLVFFGSFESKLSAHSIDISLRLLHVLEILEAIERIWDE